MTIFNKIVEFFCDICSRWLMNGNQRQPTNSAGVRILS